MTTSENASSVTVDQLPELPEGFHWKITSAPSSIDPRIVQTRLWLRRNTAMSDDPGLGYSMSNNDHVAFTSVTKGAKWIQDPSLEVLTAHAEAILSKTSTRWTLGLPTDLEAPQI
jgi:hypothetical protein